MPELVLALDVGTTGARALVIDPDGRVHGAGRRRLETVHPAPGRAEQDAETVWRLTLDAVAEALAAAGRRPGDLAAVGVATQRGSLVVWRRGDGAAAGPMILWSDLAGAEVARDLQAAGFAAWPQAPACKLESLLARCGEGGDLLWGGLDSYLVHRLSGGSAHVTDLSSAWFSGWLDPLDGGRWRAPLLARTGVDEARLPRLVDTWGELATTSAAVLGAAVPVTALAGDQQAGLFAHGGLHAGGGKISLGTSAVAIACTGPDRRRARASMPPEIVARHAGRVVWGVEGMVVTAGAAVEWMSRGLGLFPDAETLCAAAARAAPGGVALRPSLSGLGAPYGRYDARGLIAGLHPGVAPGDLARALLEGIAFRLREICGALAAAVPLDAELRVDGGLSASPLLLQLLADATGRPVRRLAAREGAAVGVGLAAAMGAGLLTEADLPARARYDLLVEPAVAPGASETAFRAWAQAVGLDAAAS